MADVFLSYKKEDFSVAERVVAALKAEAFSVWWDDGLTPKEAWDAMLEREIAAAAGVIVLWSPRSVASDWVRTEAHYAQDRNKLVPVMIEKCTIPLAFMLKQTVDLSAWSGDRADRHWRKLLTWLADIVATKPGNANVPKSYAGVQPNRFREAVGQLPAGDPIVDGGLINSSTPAGTAFRDEEGMPVMRIVPAGGFLLGASPEDPDRTTVEGPQTRIEIPAPFALGVYPVIVREYDRFARDIANVAAPPRETSLLTRVFGAKPATPQAQTPTRREPELPVTNVSFHDAQAFAAELSKASGETYRLPSEAEWEYACRAGSRSRYTFADTLDKSQALFDWGQSPKGPSAPGSFPPNSFGLYDMHGNVREWTADLWHESYDEMPSDGRPSTQGHGSLRVVRGGGWSDKPAMLRSAARARATETLRVPVIGFRVARAIR